MANQNEERANAIAKIRKLRNQTMDRGRTEAEAAIAMDRMSDLMQVYDITMDEVALAGIEFVQEHIALGSTKTNFMSDVLVAIGRFTGVVVWRGREPESSIKYTANGKYRRMMAFFFFGAKEDVEMALYLYEVIESVIRNESQKYSKNLVSHGERGYKRRMTHGFQQGMIYRINQQLNEHADSREDRIDSSTGTDLVVAKDAMINEQLAKRGINLRKTYSQRRGVNASAYAAGNTAGQGINLSRPINSGPGGQKLLA